MKRSVEVVLMIGIPGSGKSSFYEENFAMTHLRVNLDMLKTRKREHSLFNWCLQNRQSCVIDDTNVAREIRSRWMEPALEAQASVRGYFLQSRIPEFVDGLLGGDL